MGNEEDETRMGDEDDEMRDVEDSDSDILDVVQSLCKSLSDVRAPPP